LPIRFSPNFTLFPYTTLFRSETLISSARSNISRISLSRSKPIALNSVVTGNFFLRSIYAYITELISVANSIQEPLNGITRAEYRSEVHTSELQSRENLE